jgi:hypothetical protein
MATPGPGLLDANLLRPDQVSIPSGAGATDQPSYTAHEVRLAELTARNEQLEAEVARLHELVKLLHGGGENGMSRRLTGSITPHPNRGTFTASLPRRRNSRLRRTATFDTRKAAEQWPAVGLRILEADGEVPAFRRPGTADAPTPRGTSFITVARDFIRERYAEDRHGDVDREDQVIGYAQAVDSDLTHEALSIEDLTRRRVRAMWQHMPKTDAPRPRTDDRPPRSLCVGHQAPRPPVAQLARARRLGVDLQALGPTRQ